MGQLEDIAQDLQEVKRLLNELIALQKAKDKTSPIPYPIQPYPVSPPFTPNRPHWEIPIIWSSTTTNTSDLAAQAEPKDTEHPADPGWHDDPDVSDPEDG